MNPIPTPAPVPTPETVRLLVRTLLSDDAAPGPGPDVRPVRERGGHTWWVGRRHVLRLALDREASCGNAVNCGCAIWSARSSGAPFP